MTDDSARNRRRLVRSRSRGQRLRERSGQDCCYCLARITSADITWNCVTCDAVCHDACMPRREDGSIHLSTGCPQCRTRGRDVIALLKEPVAAPHGAICKVCYRPIDPGTPMHKCGAPSAHCIASWHTRCNSEVRRGCPGCGLTPYDAMVMRQHRQP